MNLNKFLTIIILYYFPVLCNSQTWFPINTKAYYSIRYENNLDNPNPENFISITASKDTIFQNKTCRLLEVKRNDFQLISNEIILQNGDSIFYFNQGSQKFHLLYNFSAKVGDTIIVHNSYFKPNNGFLYILDSIPGFNYLIKNIDSIKNNGKWIKQQTIVSNYENSQWGFSINESKILQGIGSLIYFFGTNTAFITPETVESKIRCYNELSFEFKNSSWSESCDLYLNISNLKNNSLTIQPNFTENIFTITSESNIEYINLYTSTGCLIKVYNLNEKESVIDLSNYISGIYYVIINTKSAQFVSKVIKY